MISGVVRGMEVIAPGRRHFTFHDMGKGYPTTSTPRSLCVRCVVADDARLDSFSAPSVAWETGKSGSGLKDVLQQQQHHILKKEREVDVWMANDISLSGEAIAPGISDGRRRLISEIAEAGGVTDEGAVARPEAVGISGDIKPTQEGDADLSSKEGDVGTSLKFDLVQGIEDVTKRAEILKEELTASASPYTPAERPDALGFFVLCVLLSVIFWLGNYFVPDLIFKDTVFKKEDPLNPTETSASENGDLGGSKEQSPGESTDAGKSNNVDNAGRSVSKVGTGFGRSTKQRRLKSAKRK